LHRVYVEQKIGSVDDRTQSASARQLHRLARAVERRGGPEAIEIFVDIPRCGRDPRIKAAIGGNVVEGQGQLALSRLQPGAVQTIERDRAANLVAVCQGGDQNVRSGDAGIEGRVVIDTGIAGSVGFDVGRGQLDGIGRLGQNGTPSLKV